MTRFRVADPLASVIHSLVNYVTPADLWSRGELMEEDMSAKFFHIIPKLENSGK